jgi:hypothetical protein
VFLSYVSTSVKSCLPPSHIHLGRDIATQVGKSPVIEVFRHLHSIRPLVEKWPVRVEIPVIA